MSFALSTSIDLGGGNTGKTLKAQLIDTDGDPVGGQIVSGFTEIGNGIYMWFYSEFGDTFQGGAKILDNTETLMTFIAINPLQDQVLPPTESAIVNAIKAIEIEPGINLVQAIAVIGSALGGILSGSTGSQIVIKALGDEDTTRITATVDGKGNRESITLNLPS